MSHATDQVNSNALSSLYAHKNENQFTSNCCQCHQERSQEFLYRGPEHKYSKVSLISIASSLRRSGITRVNKGSHKFTCHSHVYPQVK